MSIYERGGDLGCMSSLKIDCKSFSVPLWNFFDESNQMQIYVKSTFRSATLKVATNKICLHSDLT